MRNTNRPNVRHLLALALPVLIPAAAFAEPLSVDPQQTPPAATPPVVVPLAEADVSHGKIVVLPFEPVNPNETSPWLGKSIQESLVADLTVAAPGRVVSPAQAAGTLDAAIAAGRQAGARFVIAGGFITVDHELRITGQVLDVDTGKAVAGLKATGEPSQIFQMEDALALQVRGQVLGQHPQHPIAPRANEQPNVAAPNVQQPGSATPAPPAEAGISVAPAAAPQYYNSYTVAPTPAIYGADYATYADYPGYYNTGYVSDYSPYYYDSSCYYPYCGCSYPYCGYGLGWCFPFGVGFGFNFGHDFHHHDHFDHGFVSRNNGFRGVSVGGGRASLGVGISAGGGIRSSAIVRNFSTSPGFSRGATVRSGGATYRSPVVYSRGSFGRTSGFSSGYHGSFSSSHSFGGGSFHGGGGFSHSGGGHAGGHR